LVSYERAWYRQVTPDVLNALDLHWRLSNSQVFAELLTFDELYAAAVAVPQLGPSARALAPVHALILACTHRAGHFEGGRERGLLGRGDRLIWLYDVHLLIEHLSESEIEEFVRLAHATGVCAVCLDALAQCQVCFGTHVPDRIVAEFSAAGPELTALLLEGSWSARTRAEFAALPSWGVRAKLLREMVLPPGDYMLNKYQVQSRWWLPALYLRRGIEGLAKIKARIAH
jgi:hypothetical protein